MINRQEDFIYGRKHGLALTLDVFSPQGPTNGLGIVFVICGGWFSSKESMEGYWPAYIQPLVLRGYTVFALVVSSRPRYAIPDILPDVKRGIRWARHNAERFGVDPNRLGLMGFSAGGHMSLLASLTADGGSPESEDAVERESSHVQAVAEFYGPADFLNYGELDENGIGEGRLGDLKSAFDFSEYDVETQSYIPVTDANRIRAIGKEISPIYHVRADAPPTFIVHGDVDWRVPLQQSSSFVEKAVAAGAVAELLVVPGGDHGWEDMSPEMEKCVDWFDTHLGAAL